MSDDDGVRSRSRAHRQTLCSVPRLDFGCENLLAGGIESFPKTSGSKGLQIYVPLNTPTSYDQTKDFAHAIARLLEQEHRGMVVSNM